MTTDSNFEVQRARVREFVAAHDHNNRLLPCMWSGARKQATIECLTCETSLTADFPGGLRVELADGSIVPINEAPLDAQAVKMHPPAVH